MDASTHVIERARLKYLIRERDRAAKEGRSVEMCNLNVAIRASKARIQAINGARWNR